MVTNRDIYNFCVSWYRQGLDLKYIIKMVKYKYDIKSLAESKRIVEFNIYNYIKGLGFLPRESEELTDVEKFILHDLCGDK